MVWHAAGEDDDRITKAGKRRDAQISCDGPGQDPDRNLFRDQVPPAPLLHNTVQDTTHGTKNKPPPAPIDYAAHAATLRMKLDALVRQKRELDEAYASAEKMNKDAKFRLRCHDNEEAYYPFRRSDIDDWRSLRAEIMRTAKWSEDRMEQVRIDAREKRLSLKVDEVVEKAGWGPVWTGMW